MATFSIMVEFEVKADDYDHAEAIGKQITEAVRLEKLSTDAKVQDIEMLDDDELPDLDYNEDDE